MPSFLVSAFLLVLCVGAGIVAIVTIRARYLTQGDDRGDWEKSLVDYRNLRDQGVLSEEEYRKIRTLVEPRLRADAAMRRQRPTGGRPGPDPKRK